MGSRLLAAAAFLGCAALIFWYALVHTVHLGTLSVPDLRGLDLAHAEQSAHDLGLAVVVEEPGAFSAAVEPGAIATQQPYAGFHVKTGSTVRVRLSLGTERVTIPDVRGETLQAALRRLEQSNLTPGSHVEVLAAAGGDSIVATEPPIGTEVAPGSTVTLLVNVTPERELWVMPSLILRPLDATRRFCRNARLRLGQVHEVAYPGIPSQVVLRQYPPAGSPLSRSDIITIWVSR